MLSQEPNQFKGYGKLQKISRFHNRANEHAFRAIIFTTNNRRIEIRRRILHNPTGLNLQKILPRKKLLIQKQRLAFYNQKHFEHLRPKFLHGKTFKVLKH